MPLPSFHDQTVGLANRHEQRWPWWPLLPLYPYGRRRTLVRTLVPGRIWSFEQLHGTWYVAVPIRMTVVKVGEGLMLYAPIPPTEEVVARLRELETEQGPIETIVLPTASGLEHKLPVPALARAFPRATLWVTDQQWSFPLRLPASWLGFPRQRTRVLGRDGVPHAEQLDWIPLGPLELGLGTFLEQACLDRATGALLVTDALVAIQDTPPDLFAEDPTPLLFHARDSGSEPLIDSEANRRKGWKRILLFANFFRPASVSVPAPGPLLRDLFQPGCRTAREHFGFYPFRWSAGWESEASELLRRFAPERPAGLAPVLERLVFPGAQRLFVDWLRQLARRTEIKLLIPAHYQAPQPCDARLLLELAERVQAADWAPSDASWATLAAIDQTLLNWRLIPPR
ncbi:MAG: DUF4336 domain-containing protein [Cyanobacteria bacterium K_Offshore_surface_m2_239]|nr:DUF4336 domain-containing protein [Cyanobacteria bacterium K_Offshore_surface_m2_239]